MARPSIHVDAARKDRSLVNAATAKRQVVALPTSFWSRLISSAVYDAKRTQFGLPTDVALMQRWWIEEFRPKREDRDAWECSFECACEWLSKDVAEMRKRLIAEIDASLERSLKEWYRTSVYQRRAAVLSCAGVPTRIGKNYVLPLVSELDFEDVAGVEHGDPARVSKVMKAA